MKYGCKSPRLTTLKRTTVNSPASQMSLLKPPRGAADSGPRQIRLQILSDLIAQHAATEKSVVAFRRKHLAEWELQVGTTGAISEVCRRPNRPALAT